MEFPRQEYWRGLPFPSPEELSDPGIEPESPALQADSTQSEPLFKNCYYIAFEKEKSVMFGEYLFFMKDLRQNLLK